MLHVRCLSCLMLVSEIPFSVNRVLKIASVFLKLFFFFCNIRIYSSNANPKYEGTLQNVSLEECNLMKEMLTLLLCALESLNNLL
jgi:hypothetical protein